MSAHRCDTSQHNFKLNGLLGPQAVGSVAAIGISSMNGSLRHPSKVFKLKFCCGGMESQHLLVK